MISAKDGNNVCPCKERMGQIQMHLIKLIDILEKLMEQKPPVKLTTLELKNLLFIAEFMHLQCTIDE